MSIKILKEFFKTSAMEGLLLLLVLFVTLIISNSSLYPAYLHLIGSSFSSIALSHFINDGLMSFFFLLLSLEIKRTLINPETDRRQMLLPVVSACGGVLIPALIYLAFVGSYQALIRGWAIPVATDVALALGLLSLLGKRVPVTLKLFLSILAVADDLIAIIIIAVFYTEAISWLHLGCALVGLLALIVLNRLKVTNLIPYFAIGFGIWFAIQGSGLHATLAGVILGFCIPAPSPLTKTEHFLRPWVAYLIVPLFIFVNAGVPFLSHSVDLLSPLPLGIALGLFLGKQIGVFIFAMLLIKFGWASLPKECSWLDLYGISVLAGIGFTMSLFVSQLAFGIGTFQIESHVGILLGSGLSAILGMGILYCSRKK